MSCIRDDLHSTSYIYIFIYLQQSITILSLLIMTYIHNINGWLLNEVLTMCISGIFQYWLALLRLYTYISPPTICSHTKRRQTVWEAHLPCAKYSFLFDFEGKNFVIYGIRPRVISSPKKNKNINVFNHSFTFFECFMVRYIVLHTIWNVNYQFYYLVNIQEWLCVSLHFELVLYRDIFSWNHIDHFTVNVYSHNLHSPWCSQHIIDTSLVPINY